MADVPSDGKLTVWTANGFYANGQEPEEYLQIDIDGKTVYVALDANSVLVSDQPIFEMKDPGEHWTLEFSRPLKQAEPGRVRLI